MKGTIHEAVTKLEGRLVEITELRVVTCDVIEQERLEMLKARATVWGVEVFPTEAGTVVVRLIRPLRKG